MRSRAWGPFRSTWKLLISTPWPPTATNGCLARKDAASSTFAKSRQDSIFPQEFGWTNVAGYNDYASRDMALRQDAGRYECGTLNTIGCYGLRASLDLLLEAGVERVAPAIQSLADRLVVGALNKGYQLLGDRTPENGAGIVAIQKPGLDSRKVVYDLKQKGILAAPRQGWIRLSPHFYISPEDIDRVIEELP